MEKTTKIRTLLEDFDKNEAKKIERTFEECLKSICCEKIDWKDFEIFNPSCEMMSKMLKSMSPEFIMTICDKLCQQNKEKRTVKIGFIFNAKETKVETINRNANTVLAFIELTNKRKAEMIEKTQ